jgi:RHS repeat-associated protein
MYNQVLQNGLLERVLEGRKAFGMGIKNREYVAFKDFRYKFNGKETDSETGTQDYGMRIYDTRLGKFLSVDPLASKFAFYTPYQFAGNKPIWALDLDGLEDVYFQNVDPVKSDAIIKRIHSTEIGHQIMEDFKNCNKGFDAVFVPVQIPAGLRSTDAYQSQIFDQDVPDINNPAHFTTAKETLEKMDEINDPTDEDYQAMNANLRIMYGDFMDNPDFVGSLKKGRNVIVFNIDEQTVNVVDPNIPSTQKTASSTTAHEIAAHGQNIAEGIKLDVDKKINVDKEHSNFKPVEEQLNKQLNESIKESEAQPQ